jgi:NDP-sugar pyrophosphorylase family protein
VNILIPIAGRDRYFPESEYFFPKPLIDIVGAPLIEHTVTSLVKIDDDARFTFVVQDEDCRRYSIDNVLRMSAPKGRAEVVRLKASTQGAICSCLMAIDHLDPGEELIIANSDQVIYSDLKEIIAEFRERKLDAAVVTFDSKHPRYSYIRTDEQGRITESDEKRVISRHAIAGLYYFRRSSEFVESAARVLNNDSPIQGSFFISQALNEMILAGKLLGHREIPSKDYYPLYNPKKLSEYEESLFAGHSTVASSSERPILVIPMAGEGSRFAQAGYKRPKPFIDVAGKPMIHRVLDNLNFADFDTILLARTEHLAREPDFARDLLARHSIRIIPVDHPTEGSVCTVLCAQRDIKRDAPLLIVNCDQIIDFDCRKFIADCLKRKLDGSILVFRESQRSPKWSYVRTNSAGLVVEAKEKVAISDLATVGIYFFAKGSSFVDAALEMIAHNDRVNNEFYTCPVYNYMIAQGLKVGIFEIDKLAMHGLGVPEDLEAYLDLQRGGAKIGTV